MRLNITTVTSCEWLIVVPVTLLKLENGLKKYIPNIARIKYRFVKLVDIL